MVTEVTGQIPSQKYLIEADIDIGQTAQIVDKRNVFESSSFAGNNLPSSVYGNKESFSSKSGFCFVSFEERR